MKRQDPATEYDEYGDEGARRQNARVGLIAGCAAFMAVVVLLVSVLTTTGLRREPELHTVPGPDEGTDPYDTRDPVWDTGDFPWDTQPGFAPDTYVPVKPPIGPYPGWDETQPQEPDSALPDRMTVANPNGCLYMLGDTGILDVDLSASGDQMVMLPENAGFSLFRSDTGRQVSAVFEPQNAGFLALKPGVMRIQYAVSLPDGIPDGGIASYVSLQLDCPGGQTLTAENLLLIRVGTSGVFRLDQTAYPVGTEAADVLFASTTNDGSMPGLLMDWTLMTVSDPRDTMLMEHHTPRVQFDLVPPGGGPFAVFNIVRTAAEYAVRTSGDSYWTETGRLDLTGLKPGTYRLIYHGELPYDYDPAAWDGQAEPFFDFVIYDPNEGAPTPLYEKDVSPGTFALVRENGEAVIPYPLTEAYGEGNPEQLRGRFPMLTVREGEKLICIGDTVSGSPGMDGPVGVLLSKNPFPGAHMMSLPSPEYIPAFIMPGAYYVFMTTDSGHDYGLYIVIEPYDSGQE